MNKTIKYHTEMIEEHYRRFENGEKDFLSLCMFHIDELKKFICKKLRKLEDQNNG